MTSQEMVSGAVWSRRVVLVRMLLTCSHPPILILRKYEREGQMGLVDADVAAEVFEER